MNVDIVASTYGDTHGQCSSSAPPKMGGKNFYKNTLINVHDKVKRMKYVRPRRLFHSASALGEIHRRQAPEIFALVNCKEVEYHQGPGRDKDRRLSIGSTAFWKDSIFERNT